MPRPTFTTDLRLSGLPAALAALILLLEPALQRAEIFDQGVAGHFAAACEGFQRIGPGLGRAHFQHRVQLLADLLVAVEGAAAERSLPAGLVAGRLVELELKDPGEEVAR